MIQRAVNCQRDNSTTIRSVKVCHSFAHGQYGGHIESQRYAFCSLFLLYYVLPVCKTEGVYSFKNAELKVWQKEKLSSQHWGGDCIVFYCSNERNETFTNNVKPIRQ